MLCFFKFLIDFDWIEDHLILGRISLIFFKKIDQIEFGSGCIEQVSRVGSVLPPLLLVLTSAQFKLQRLC
jgi:hypothetical protein